MRIVPGSTEGMRTLVSDEHPRSESEIPTSRMETFATPPTAFVADAAVTQASGVEFPRTSHFATKAAYLHSERFVEREVIGYGGMGYVIRAFDTKLQRDVAIKVLSAHAATSDTEIERLCEEARIMAHLEHPHIVPIYELATDDRGAYFLCMKLVEGETLEHTLEWAGLSRLEPPLLTDLLNVFLKVCDAVSFAHSRGIIHRDLKPSNIMIGDFGQVYVLDWGIARPSPGSSRSRDSQPDSAASSDPMRGFIGTPCYMAPEQLRGLHDELDERTDVFALGATLYHILTGQPPRLSGDLRAIMLRHEPVEIVRPEQVVEGGRVPDELSRIALLALSHEPGRRYPSVLDLEQDVAAWVHGASAAPRFKDRFGQRA